MASSSRARSGSFRGKKLISSIELPSYRYRQLWLHRLRAGPPIRAMPIPSFLCGPAFSLSAWWWCFGGGWLCFRGVLVVVTWCAVMCLSRVWFRGDVRTGNGGWFRDVMLCDVMSNNVMWFDVVWCCVVSCDVKIHNNLSVFCFFTCGPYLIKSSLLLKEWERGVAKSHSQPQEK